MVLQELLCWHTKEAETSFRKKKQNYLFTYFIVKKLKMVISDNDFIEFGLVGKKDNNPYNKQIHSLL